MPRARTAKEKEEDFLPLFVAKYVKFSGRRIFGLNQGRRTQAYKGTSSEDNAESGQQPRTQDFCFKSRPMGEGVSGIRRARITQSQANNHGRRIFGLNQGRRTQAYKGTSSEDNAESGQKAKSPMTFSLLTSCNTGYIIYPCIPST